MVEVQVRGCIWIGLVQSGGRSFFWMGSDATRVQTRKEGRPRPPAGWRAHAYTHNANAPRQQRARRDRGALLDGCLELRAAGAKADERQRRELGRLGRLGLEARALIPALQRARRRARGGRLGLARGRRREQRERGGLELVRLAEGRDGGAKRLVGARAPLGNSSRLLALAEAGERDVGRLGAEHAQRARGLALLALEAAGGEQLGDRAGERLVERRERVALDRRDVVCIQCCRAFFVLGLFEFVSSLFAIVGSAAAEQAAPGGAIKQQTASSAQQKT